MNPIHSNFQQSQYLDQLTETPQQPAFPQPHQATAVSYINPNAIPSKVSVGGDSFFVGTLKSRLDAASRLYLSSSLNPDINAPMTLRQDGMVSYLVNHFDSQGRREVLAVTVDVDRNKYLSGLVAARVSDNEVVLEARFGSNIHQLARRLVDAMRSKVADQVQNTMLAQGPKWYCELSSGESVTMKRLSNENIRILKAKIDLQSLKSFERDFINHLIDEPLYLTHATPADSDVKMPDGTVGLLSRQALLQRRIEFNTDNTSEQDINMLANDDHVFFALEAGNEPQKDRSRFGDKMFRFKFDQPKILQNATLHLVDPLTALPPSAQSRFDVLEDHEDENLAADVICNLDSREYVPADATFHGPHMKLGLALSIIQICRQNMNEEISQEILQGESINNVINGLLRPTVMVPRRFFDKPKDESDILIY